MTHRTSVIFALCAAAASLAPALGCEDKPKESKVDKSDAAASQAAAVDPDLAEAVEAVGAKPSGDAGAGQESGNGPPPTGVFAPGKADEQLKRGAPPKITLGEAGREPRAVLASPVAPGWKENASIELKLHLGRAALPGVAFDLTLESPKPKAAAPAMPGAAPAAAPAQPEPSSDGTPMVAKINGVKLTEDVGPQGQQLLAQLGRMKGSRIDYRIVGGGVGVDFKYQLAKGAEQDLDMVLRSLSEALETTTIGVPKEAVGPGAFWMVTTRGTVSGAEVISYRLIKLEKVEGSAFSLNVSTKRYSVSSKLDLVGLPPGAELDQFQSTADGTVTLEKGAPLASGGSVKQTFLAALTPAGGGDQRLGVQSSADVTMTLGKK
jgi:hypothetical protein